MQAPLKQEAPLLLEIFSMIFACADPSELVNADAAAALSDVTNSTANAGKAASGKQAARQALGHGHADVICRL